MGIPKSQTVTVTGISGVHYTLELYPMNSSWNSVPGVYVIIRKGQLERYDTIYIGETKDLKERMSNHHKKFCFKQHRATHLGFLYETSIAKRLYVEKSKVRDGQWIPRF